MSITLISGTPGSGKSLLAAGMIREALNKPRGVDRPVIANFPVNADLCKRPDAFCYYENSQITPSLLTDFADGFWRSVERPFSEDYLLLVLDECQIIFNARSWQDKGRSGKGDSRLDWLEFLSQHRKYGYKVVLIAQSAKMIDNQFRMLIDDEINSRKVDGMGMVGGLVGLICRHRLFMRVHYLYQSNERLGMRMSIGRTADMRMYDSYARLRKVASG